MQTQPIRLNLKPTHQRNWLILILIIFVRNLNNNLKKNLLTSLIAASIKEIERVRNETKIQWLHANRAYYSDCYFRHIVRCSRTAIH